MDDLLKRTFSLGLGALLLTKEKVEDVVEELIKRGEVGEKEGKELINELVEKGEGARKNLEEAVKNIIAKIDFPTRREFNELKSEVERLKEKLTS